MKHKFQNFKVKFVDKHLTWIMPVLLSICAAMIITWSDVQGLKERKADKLDLANISSEIKLNTQATANLAKIVEELKDLFKSSDIAYREIPEFEFRKNVSL